MPLRRAFPAILLLLLLAPDARAQAVAGRVLDAETDEPVVSAHVFVDGTSIGDVTTGDGSFSVRIPPFLPFRIVVSMIGYEQTELEIRSEAQAADDWTIRLVPHPVELDEFVVEADLPREWRRLLESLTEILFSTTDGGLRCTIRNPEMLDLAEVDGVLAATAPVPIEIDNPWLGYRIAIHGFRFSGDRKFFRWSGRIRFEELEEDGPLTARFAERRAEAWRGSMRHFFRALATDRLPENGFEAALVDAAGRMRGADPVQESGRSERSGATRILFGESGSGSRSVLFPGTLLVRFVRDTEPPEYARHMRAIAPDNPFSAGRDAVQASWLELPSGMAIVDTLGNVVTDGSTFPVSHFGYWAWKRLGDLLPAEYLPPR